MDQTTRSEERLKLAVETAKLYVWELDYAEQTLSKVGADDQFFEVPQTYEQVVSDPFGSVDARDRASLAAVPQLRELRQ